MFIQRDGKRNLFRRHRDIKIKRCENSMSEKKRKECLLLIDDDHMQLTAMGRILSPQYDVKIAKGGEAGLKLAAEFNVDLILLDLLMEDMSGFEVLARLKESDETKDILVVIVSGSDSIEDEAKGLALGAADFIRKPFSTVLVSLRIKRLLQLAAQINIIKNFSLTDGLTGINNRRGFNHAAKSAWCYCRREEESFSLLILDIDNFKRFNDKYGHLNGDICLKTIASTVQETLERENGSVYRWGGEEFAVLLPATPLEDALRTAERIRETVEATPVQLDGQPVCVTVSIGVGGIDPVGMEFDGAFPPFCAGIDKALYRAKEYGRNRVEKA